ncbi:MAG: hypothetical protein ACYC1E_11910 [Propionibacteriaceae bacterium]
MPKRRAAEDRLRLFVDRVERLAKRRAIDEQTVHARLSFEFGEEEGMIFSADLGDPEDLRSLLMDFRPFVSAKEDVYVPRIFNLLEQMLTDQGLIEDARQNREAWKTLMAGLVPVYVNDHKYDAEHSLDLILNGDLFHMDVDKSEEIERLPGLVQDVLRHNVASTAIQALTVLWPTKNIIEMAFAQGALSPAAG